MTVRIEEGVIMIGQSCPVEDAEVLLETILANPELPVDWSQCRYLHTAGLQVLMAARPRLRGSPDDAFLRRWVEPVLSGGG